jgi:hypothetical protein
VATPAAILSILVQAKGIEQTSRKLDDIDKSAKRTAASTDKLDKKFSNLDRSVGDFNRTMTGAKNVIGLVKFPALIAGAGMAAQAVGALGAATVSLGAAMAPLAGALPAYAAGYVALGQAVGTVKLATQGLEPAMKAVEAAQDGTKKSADKLEAELKKLTPAQREFVGELVKAQPQIKKLQETAASGMLPGLTDALKSVTPLFGRLKAIVGETAAELGNLARRAGEIVGKWGPDLTTVGKTNVTVIHNLGRAALSLATAMKDIVVVGGPLLVWLTEMTAKGAEWVRQQVHAGRESGRLAGFLEETKSVMVALADIAGNLAVGLFNIAKAGKPLGDELLTTIEALSAKFRAWTESAGGQNQIAAYFEAAREPVMQLGGLVGDLGGAFLRLSQGDATGPLIEQMRTLVPILESVIANTTSAFGPTLIDSLGQILTLFGDIAGSNGPLIVFVGIIGSRPAGLQSRAELDGRLVHGALRHLEGDLVHRRPAGCRVQGGGGRTDRANRSHERGGAGEHPAARFDDRDRCRDVCDAGGGEGDGRRTGCAEHRDEREPDPARRRRIGCARRRDRHRL